MRVLTQPLRDTAVVKVAYMLSLETAQQLRPVLSLESLLFWVGDGSAVKTRFDT